MASNDNSSINTNGQDRNVPSASVSNNSDNRSMPSPLVIEIINNIDSLSENEKLSLSENLALKNDLVVKVPYNPYRSPGISKALTWVYANFKHEENKKLNENEIYEEYREYCFENHMQPLPIASFGNFVMQLFPDVKTQCLNTRPISQYDYLGLCRIDPTPRPTLIHIDRSVQDAVTIAYMESGPNGASSDEQINSLFYSDLNAIADYETILHESQPDKLNKTFMHSKAELRSFLKSFIVSSRDETVVLSDDEDSHSNRGNNEQNRNGSNQSNEYNQPPRSC